MVKNNPFTNAFDAQKDELLIEEAIKGNRNALNDLIQRHNNFIYNVALKMLGNPEDAKDLTQDILIKVITNLSRYDAKKAQFRTWLYRIAFNHILNYKKSTPEKNIRNFQQFFSLIEQVPDDPVPELHSDDFTLFTEETKLKCMSGMLMCVSREDRLLYIVGDLFGIDHNLGAKIFELSKANFRKKLSRIRNDLRQWMHNKCGLVNKDNPCRCVKKTKGFIKLGVVDPENLIWDKGYTQRIEAFTKENLQDSLLSSDKVYSRLYQTHPFKETKTAKEVVDEIVSDDNIREFLNF